MVRVIFIHPDLGIGGAERLVVDAGLALKSHGHDVQIVTAHHDNSHCFEETRDGSLHVTTVGDWLPRHCCGGFYAFWAYVRMVYVALYLVFFSSLRPDVVICDQISACVPVLKLGCKAKVVFYCHFPDMLLTQRRTLLKKLYRAPLDWVEEFTTGLADVVLVNSNFTAETFVATFTTLRNKRPSVLYPSLNFKAFDSPALEDSAEDIIPPSAKTVFLSINRYERKKNLKLTLEALAWLKNILSDVEWKGVHLVMAGGYDHRVTENKEHYLELRQLTEQYNLTEKVTFVRSFSDSQKISLLNGCSCLIYTPSLEHFGIVPIEAMYMKRPVIAVNSGGPLETIKDGETGFLCAPDAESFARAMGKFVKDPALRDKLGDAGHKHVMNTFSFKVFAQKLHDLVSVGSGASCTWSTAVTCLLMITMFCTATLWVLTRDY